MRVYQSRKTVLEIAATILLLVFATASGMQAQVTQAPTLPPAPATLPASQTTPPGFETLGFIEYASVDTLCDPVPPAAPLNTDPAGPTPTPAPVYPDCHAANAFTAGAALLSDGVKVRSMLMYFTFD